MSPLMHRTAAQIFEELARRREAPQATDRRKSDRKFWPIHVTVSWSGGAVKQAVKVLAQNVSEHGLCFFATEFTGVGTEVTVRFHCLPDHPTLCGVVRHEGAVAWTFHRIGVEFSEHALSP